MIISEQGCPDSIPSLRSTGLLGRLLGVGGRQVGLAVHLQLHGVLHLQRCGTVLLNLTTNITLLVYTGLKVLVFGSAPRQTLNSESTPPNPPDPHTFSRHP